MSEKFQEISPADFFYRNRDLAGFNNPARALYSAIRELIENSLDACELYEIAPNIYLRISLEIPPQTEEGESIYRIRIMDNGSGIPPEFIPSAFGQILFGSKYTLRQVRGTFGLGGKMAILYGQITTHGSATITSSTGTVRFSDLVSKAEVNVAKKQLELQLNTRAMKNRGVTEAVLEKELLIKNCHVLVEEKSVTISHARGGSELRKILDLLPSLPIHVAINEFEISIDIQRNKPVIQRSVVKPNKENWRGTIVEFTVEGDYVRAMSKVVDYLKQTAMVNPYAEITYIDPKGRLYRFDRVTTKMPIPPRETLPHPHGCDVETLQRMIDTTECSNMLTFLSTHFHRVGKTIARAFLKSANVAVDENPKKLTSGDIVKIVRTMKTFQDFLPPDSSCLSPLGRDLLEAGIRKELNPEFLFIEPRNPIAYSGYPFIVEVGMAYGGDVPASPELKLFRFANRIPLLYDEASDVTRKVVNEEINWRYYKISSDMPIAIIVHICSTKIPYKTVGKEFIADRPEVEREIKNGISVVARRLSVFLSKKMTIEHERRRRNIFSKYLPQIAQFSTSLAGRKDVPDVNPLLRSLMRFGSQDN
ncbi:MAG: DNA topoisomerase VI subunit B [Candidatus Bathyarchaeota archaeon]